MGNSTDNTGETGGLVTYSLLVDGSPVSEAIEIESIDIHQEINVITRATLVIVDGDPETGDFVVSNSNTFSPGKSIEIGLGYEAEKINVFKGIIISNSQKADGEKYLLTVECRDMAVKMTMDKSSSHYENISATDIAENLLSRYGITGTDITPSGLIHKQLVQFNSSDWDFMISTLDADCYLCILNNGETIIRQMAAEPAGTELVTLEFGDSVLEFEGSLDSRTQSENVTVRSWNHTTQEIEEAEGEVTTAPGDSGGISAEELGRGQSITIRSGGKKESTERQALANAKKIRQTLTRMKGKVKFFGRVENPVLPGDFVQLNRLGNNFSGPVFVSAIRHDYSEGNWTITATLGWNEKYFTEQINPYSEVSSSGELSSSLGLQAGIITDILDGESDYRIKLRLPLVDNQQEGVYARLATLDAGNQRGSFFMPEIGDEVVVGFMNNDTRHPVVLGMLHSNSRPAPLEPETANDKKGYVSRSAIKIIIDDGSTSVTLETPGGRVFTMNDSEGKISVSDASGNKITMESTGVSIESATELTLKAGTTLSIAAPQLSVKADAGLNLEGGGSTKLKSSGTLVLQGSMVIIN